MSVQFMPSVSGDVWWRTLGTDRITAYDTYGHYQGETTVRIGINEFRQVADPIAELKKTEEDVQTQIRAETLLKEVLGEQRYAIFLQSKQLTIPSKSHKDRYYVVREYGRVEVVDNGVITEELCLVPQGVQLVGQDVLALKKLMLESNEKEFLKIANHFPRYEEEPMSDVRRSFLRRLQRR